MTTQDKFNFIRGLVNDSKKLEFLAKNGLDTRELLRYYGGVINKEMDEATVNAEYPIILNLAINYNQKLIQTKLKK